MKLLKPGKWTDAVVEESRSLLVALDLIVDSVPLSRSNLGLLLGE